MVTEAADRLRARISELESELATSSKSNSKGLTNSSSETAERTGSSERKSRQQQQQYSSGSLGAEESLDERVEVMNGLLKELRGELIHKEEVCLHSFSSLILLICLYFLTMIGCAFEQSIAVERSKSEQLLAEVRHKLTLASQECAQLRKDLAARPRVEEVAGLRRQLRVLQKVS